MKKAENQDDLTVAALTAMIARSQIVLAQAEKPAVRLPAGFDAVDLAILDWIAAEGRRAGRSFQRI